jgi:LTXXQ motif family protein
MTWTQTTIIVVVAIAAGLGGFALARAVQGERGFGAWHDGRQATWDFRYARAMSGEIAPRHCTQFAADPGGWIARIKHELAIAPGQAQSWDLFATAANEASLILEKICTETTVPRQVAAGLPARLDRMETWLAAGLALTSKLRAPLEGLYSELDEAQRAKLDSAAAWRRH